MAYATVDELAAALRIRVNPDNTDALQACLDAAAAEIDHDIDVEWHDAIPSGSWRYSTSTVAADPGPGVFRLDLPNANAATALYVDSVDADGTDRGDGTDQVVTGDIVRLGDTSLRWVDFTVTADATDHAGWWEVPVNASGFSFDPLSLVEDDAYILAVLRVTRPVADKLALANRVNVLRGVEWYKAQDAAFGVIGFDQTGALQAPRDGFNRHAFTLTPLKQAWGIA